MQAFQLHTEGAAFSGGVHYDAGAIVGSLLLLTVLLAITFERILGLDRVVANALREWKAGREAERRKKMLEAREAMERQFRDPD